MEILRFSFALHIHTLASLDLQKEPFCSTYTSNRFKYQKTSKLGCARFVLNSGGLDWTIHSENYIIEKLIYINFLLELAESKANVPHCNQYVYMHTNVPLFPHFDACKQHALPVFFLNLAFSDQAK